MTGQPANDPLITRDGGGVGDTCRCISRAAAADQASLNNITSRGLELGNRSQEV